MWSALGLERTEEPLDSSVVKGRKEERKDKNAALGDSQVAMILTKA